MDDADLEARAGQERALAPAPHAVFGRVRVAQCAHVVASVIVHHQQPPVGPEHPIGFGQVRGSTPRNAVHSVTTASRLRVGSLERERARERQRKGRDTARGQAIAEVAVREVDEPHLAARKRAERFESADELSLDVDRGPETRDQRCCEHEREIRHVSRGYAEGKPRRAGVLVPGPPPFEGGSPDASRERA